MKEYTPQNWYWIVGNDETQVYSSASGDYVPVSDATYVSWLADGGKATRITSSDELGEVLAAYAARPTNADVLDKYQGSHADKLTVKVVAKVLFYFANEIRALKGQQPVTAAQFRSFLKGLM